MVVINGEAVTPLTAAARKSNDGNAQSAMRAARLAGDKMVATYLKWRFFRTDNTTAVS